MYVFVPYIIYSLHNYETDMGKWSEAICVCSFLLLYYIDARTIGEIII